MFNFNLAVIFSKVVEKNSITKAALALGIPKATVSRKLAALEDELGVRLMQRTTRSLSLTDTGRTYYQSCQDALAAIHEANLEASQTQEEPSGLLKISAPVVFGDQFLSGPLIEFMLKYPKIDLKVDLTDRLVDLVAEDFDLTFRVGQLTDSSYIARRLGGTRQVVIASEDYLNKFGSPKTPKDLQNHQMIGYNDNLSKKTLHFSGPNGSENINISPSLIINSLNVMRDTSISGLGITILPIFMALEPLRAGKVKIILPEWEFQFGDLYLVYPSKRHVATKVRTFIDFMLDIYKSNKPWLPNTEELQQYVYQPTKDLLDEKSA